MQIEKHDKSYIVKLEDGSSWHRLRFSKFQK